MTALPPTVAALEARLGVAVGTLAGGDLARAQAALEDAATLALAEAPATVAAAWQIDAPTVVALVVLKAARREFDNPRGISTESDGEHSIGLAETSGVYLTGREVRQLQRAAGRVGVGTTRTASAYSA